jgi:RNA polymerase sigma-54 factor
MPKLVDAKVLVQGFDPPGIGAENLRESLLLQLERLGKVHSLEHRIIDKHLDEFAKHRFPSIAKKLGVTAEQVSAAAASIANLDPKPGSQFIVSKNSYVSADVTVERNGDEWLVVVNNESIPRLRISNSYKDIMSQAGSGQREVRSYIRDKIRSGKFLIRSIHQRQQTIENIAKEIVKRQQGFFKHGSSMLKPMNMAEVADAVGVHETTVSRAVNGKYMATPHGVLELKYFFTTGYQTEDGEVMSNTSVKEALAEIVAQEDAKKPLSDAKLVALLKEKGLTIARRTVAKYRDELHILPSHMRKTY